MIAIGGFIRQYFLGREYAHLLMGQGVPKEEVEECMTWAFGPNWKELNPSSMFNIWNRKHRDLFIFTETDTIKNSLKNVGIAWQGLKHDSFFRIEDLADLNAAEAKFRRILIQAFKAEDIIDFNEMMDCLSWGLGYDEELLRCHSYMKWPETFAKNTGIPVNDRDGVSKVIRLLARRWKSKKKLFAVRNVGGVVCPTKSQTSLN